MCIIQTQRKQGEPEKVSFLLLTSNHSVLFPKITCYVVFYGFCSPLSPDNNELH